ncbi:glycoside hydrolase family 16 protein [Rhizoctonia solani]|uniref:Glycoside hydrolase family 16 protein n=1 Tax=Rhizoctonia solani TaxID=456999 RepID=A0A8H8NQ13_9AGAM|nr:glycoside hydrolase family 16 protein [Rhizoctonia solani]QRW17881.1 glycoside hydrolase family 16 protein [Rhizoctonia solani]
MNDWAYPPSNPNPNPLVFFISKKMGGLARTCLGNPFRRYKTARLDDLCSRRTEPVYQLDFDLLWDRRGFVLRPSRGPTSTMRTNLFVDAVAYLLDSAFTLGAANTIRRDMVVDMCILRHYYWRGPKSGDWQVPVYIMMCKQV